MMELVDLRSSGKTLKNSDPAYRGVLLVSCNLYCGSFRLFLYLRLCVWESFLDGSEDDFDRMTVSKIYGDVNVII
jgi:hypothetical protein